MGNRLFTYVILAINGLFLIWLVAGVRAAASDVPGMVLHGGRGEVLAFYVPEPDRSRCSHHLLLGIGQRHLGVVWLATNGRY